jgi:hypothetical protein
MWKSTDWRTGKDLRQSGQEIGYSNQFMEPPLECNIVCIVDSFQSHYFLRSQDGQPLPKLQAFRAMYFAHNPEISFNT